MSTAATKRKTVLVAGIDTVRHKNLHQFACLERHGYDFIILTTDLLGDSAEVLEGRENVRLVVTRYGFKGFLFLLSLLKILLTTRIDIAEVYPYSFGMMLGTMLLSLMRIPTVIIARGEEYYYLHGKMSQSMMFAFRTTYRLADHVIYKELYADDFFDAMGMDSRFLLPNAVEVPRNFRRHEPDRCSFIFINSLKPFRHPETPLRAFLEICRERALDESSGIDLRIIGFQGGDAPPDIAKKEREIWALLENAPAGAPVKLQPWTSEALEAISRADVFLLPADLVYLNYSLLEAMASGLVPMVQDAPDAERILTHEQEGYILPDKVPAWKLAMETLLDNFSLRQDMAEKARQKVESEFSLTAYENQYNKIYQKILSR
jgi:glycosyltransferase involved in cell wall biosynthesis